MRRRKRLLQLEVVLLGVEGVTLLVDEVEAFAIGVREDEEAAVETVGSLQVDVGVGAGYGIRTMGGVDEGGDVGALLIVGEDILLHLAFILAEETAGLGEGVLFADLLQHIESIECPDGLVLVHEDYLWQA